jgi:translocation and assembly module TamB
VFVDYVGLLSPITEDKIHFRSDPPRSSAEIASLLVFGDTGANATGLVGTVGGSVATSLANGLIANAFGGALRDVLAVSVGTTETGGVFGAQVSVSDEVSLGGSFEQIQGDTTVNRASGGCGDLYFDYKMTTHWSLRGTGGYCYADSQATSTSNQEGVTLGLDALWQYRY